MFKRILFQTHWFVGITAGIVLAIVGLTGALLAFEGDIQGWLNADVRRVEAQSRRLLSPAALLAKVQQQAPEQRIQGLTISSDPTESARVMIAPLLGAMAASGPGSHGGPRGETRFVDPYTGQLMPGDGARGQAFFRTTRSIHRWLTAGTFGNADVGKQIVGASTALGVLLALSGLYLRWPRRWRQWRAWLALDFRLSGRSFLLHLHAVLGTWALPLVLLMALTGLYWSYPWYRNGLHALAGVEAPLPRDPGGAGAQRDPAPAPRLDIDAAWHAFTRASAGTGYTHATMLLPQDAGRPIEIRYLAAAAAHERAVDTLAVHPTSGEIQRHDRYVDKGLGARLLASVFALHSGRYFGLPGAFAFMLASLTMPLFAITGWLLYLDRRRKQRSANAACRAIADDGDEPTRADTLLLVFASQSGSARELAWQTAAALRTAGLAVDVQPASAVTPDRLQQTRRALFVVSTFGTGEPPDHARSFARRLMRMPSSLPALHFGVLALGDRRYDMFCAFGRGIDTWLRGQGAAPLFPLIEVDNGDPHALHAWRTRVGALGDAHACWSEHAFADWRLDARSVLNPGSSGGPTFHLELTAPSPMHWEAGDIAVIQPANSVAAVQAFLQRHGLHGDAIVDGAVPLRERLRHAVLPTAAIAATAQALADQLVALPLREYSIASIPTDGRVHLLVRQTANADGTLGIGSGWLTAHAALGDRVPMRVRSNPQFRAPVDATPLVLIGNGTGIAGLRSLLKARIAAGQRANWLLFGERHAAYDGYYGDQLTAWQAAGWLQHVDLAFSRDAPDRRYVQDRLREHGERLRRWVGNGAVIAVCGSADGMAPGVDAALSDLLGAELFGRLRDAGRYRRDVY